MNKKWKVVHYINQFFGQIGGEEKAFTKPKVVKAHIGPGLLLANMLGDDFEIIATIICGDNYIAENTERALEEILFQLKDYKPDILIAGPAFNAGRYGPACGAVCKEVGNKYSIPAITGMYRENPGMEMYRKYCYIVKTGDSAIGMKKAMEDMVKLTKKLIYREELKSPEDENYFTMGYKKNIFVDKNGADRAIDMLLAKIKKRPYTTELNLPAFERVEPAENIEDISKATIALVTEGGIVDKENKYNLETARATKYLEFDITNMNSLSKEKFKTIHGGFDNTFGNENPNVIVPVDIMRKLEEERIIGSLYNKIYSTSGNGTSLKNSQQFGAGIANKLKADNVDGVILVST